MLPPGSRDHTGKVTGSIMFYVAGKADEQETNDAFMRNIGAMPELEETYAMRLGKLVEPVELDWYERTTGDVVERRQEEVPLPALPNDAFATIDGFVTLKRKIIEAKFAAPILSREWIANRYGDQVIFQMMCADADSGVLLVGQGTNEPYEIEFKRDAAYEAALMERIAAWLVCVKTLTPPCPVPMPKPLPERFRTINLELDSPNWKDELECLLFVHSTTKPYVEQHEEAGRLLKALVPDDVGVVIAGDHRIARDKKGSLRITRKAA